MLAIKQEIFRKLLSHIVKSPKVVNRGVEEQASSRETIGCDRHLQGFRQAPMLSALIVSPEQRETLLHLQENGPRSSLEVDCKTRHNVVS